MLKGAQVMPMERRRQLAILVASVLAIGLLVFASVHVARWYRGGEASVQQGIRRIPLREAPMEIQEAAGRLASSRVAYAIARGATTYLIISTGIMGERIELGTSPLPTQQGAPFELNVRSSPGGERLIIAAVGSQSVNPNAIRYLLDGMPGRIPALINPDGLVPVTLPDEGGLVVTGPDPHAYILGNVIHISGFARLPSGRFQVQVLAAGKGRILGELKDAIASTGAPNWGSFRVSVPIEVPEGVTAGTVVVHDPVTGARVPIEVQFGRR